MFRPLERSATCTLKGEGVVQDYAQSLSWHRKAADAGDKNAMQTVGYQFEKGLGVAADQAEAIRWYRKAAKLGNASAGGALKRLGVSVE